MKRRLLIVAVFLLAGAVVNVAVAWVIAVSASCVGAPDWGTIPAYLQTLLEQKIETPLCIVNYGEWGYVVTQNMILLTLELRDGNVPDLVIFYDGINDVFATYQATR